MYSKIHARQTRYMKSRIFLNIFVRRILRYIMIILFTLVTCLFNYASILYGENRFQSQLQIGGEVVLCQVLYTYFAKTVVRFYKHEKLMVF